MSLSKEVNGEDTGSGDSPERTRKDQAYSQWLCVISELPLPLLSHQHVNLVNQ